MALLPLFGDIDPLLKDANPEMAGFFTTLFANCGLRRSSYWRCFGAADGAMQNSGAASLTPSGLR